MSQIIVILVANKMPIIMEISPKLDDNFKNKPVVAMCILLYLCNIYLCNIYLCDYHVKYNN